MDRRRRDHGRAPYRLRARRCASKACSSIPNPSSPSTAMPCSATFWSEPNGDAFIDPGGPAQRHRHPADRRDARGHAGRAAGRRRVRRRSERQCAAGADRRHAGLRGRAVRADRHAEQLLRDPRALPARRRVHRRPAWRIATAGRAAAPRCSAACSRSRSTMQPDGTLAARTRSRPPSSPTTRISRAPGCWRWRTRWAASCCPSPTSRRPRSWRSARGWRAISTARGSSMPRPRRRRRKAARCATRHAASRSASTACRSASARGSARRWGRRCAVRAN